MSARYSSRPNPAALQNALSSPALQQSRPDAPTPRTASTAGTPDVAAATGYKASHPSHRAFGQSAVKSLRLHVDSTPFEKQETTKGSKRKYDTDSTAVSTAKPTVGVPEFASPVHSSSAGPSSAGQVASSPGTSGAADALSALGVAASEALPPLLLRKSSTSSEREAEAVLFMTTISSAQAQHEAPPHAKAPPAAGAGAGPEQKAAGPTGRRVMDGQGGEAWSASSGAGSAGASGQGSGAGGGAGTAAQVSSRSGRTIKRARPYGDSDSEEDEEKKGRRGKRGLDSGHAAPEGGNGSSASGSAGTGTGGTASTGAAGTPSKAAATGGGRKSIGAAPAGQKALPSVPARGAPPPPPPPAPSASASASAQQQTAAPASRPSGSTGMHWILWQPGMSRFLGVSRGTGPNGKPTWFATVSLSSVNAKGSGPKRLGSHYALREKAEAYYVSRSVQYGIDPHGKYRKGWPGAEEASVREARAGIDFISGFPLTEMEPLFGREVATAARERVASILAGTYTGGPHGRTGEGAGAGAGEGAGGDDASSAAAGDDLPSSPLVRPYKARKLSAAAGGRGAGGQEGGSRGANGRASKSAAGRAGGGAASSVRTASRLSGSARASSREGSPALVMSAVQHAGVSGGVGCGAEGEGWGVHSSGSHGGMGEEQGEEEEAGQHAFDEGERPGLESERKSGSGGGGGGGSSGGRRPYATTPFVGGQGGPQHHATHPMQGSGGGMAMATPYGAHALPGGGVGGGWWPGGPQGYPGGPGHMAAPYPVHVGAHTTGTGQWIIPSGASYGAYYLTSSGGSFGPSPPGVGPGSMRPGELEGEGDGGGGGGGARERQGSGDSNLQQELIGLDDSGSGGTSGAHVGSLPPQPPMLPQHSLARAAEAATPAEVSDGRQSRGPPSVGGSAAYLGAGAHPGYYPYPLGGRGGGIPAYISFGPGGGGGMMYPAVASTPMGPASAFPTTHSPLTLGNLSNEKSSGGGIGGLQGSGVGMGASPPGLVGVGGGTGQEISPGGAALMHVASSSAISASGAPRAGLQLGLGTSPP